MAYNKAREEQKWKQWKEKEEEKLRACGMEEDSIQKLRNKYAHSTYPENEKIQVMDYIVLLKIMILVVTKINEEFCLKEQIEAMSDK